MKRCIRSSQIIDNLLIRKQIIKMNVVLIKSQTPNEEIGLRDPSGLAMAVKQPQQIVFSKELYSSMEEKAAILLINLIKTSLS